MRPDILINQRGMAQVTFEFLDLFLVKSACGTVLRAFCLIGDARASDGMAVPLKALRLDTRVDKVLLAWTEVMHTAPVMAN